MAYGGIPLLTSAVRTSGRRSIADFKFIFYLYSLDCWSETSLTMNRFVVWFKVFTSIDVKIES